MKSSTKRRGQARAIGLGSERGISLVMVIATVAILLTLSGGALLFSGLNLKASSNLKTGTSAIHVADAAIQHALALIPNGQQFTSFLTNGATGFPCNPSPCNGTTIRPTLTGSMSGYTYTVVAENDPVDGVSSTTDTNKTIVLRATATGPDGSTRRILAYIGRATVSWRPPGAIYHPGTTSQVGTSGFYGNNWKISGRDTLPDQSEGSGPESPVPGVATTDSGLTAEIKSELSGGQNNNITGQGTDPSVVTTNSTLDVDQVVTDLLNMSTEGVDKQTINLNEPDQLRQYPADGSCDWGTPSSPKIIYVTSSNWQELQLGVASGGQPGSCKGYGILITGPNVDVHFAGNFKWYGLIIPQRHLHFDPTHFGRNASEGATLYGSVLLPQRSSEFINMGGTSKVFYSSRAIVNYVLSRWNTAFPVDAPPKIIAWSELMN